MCDAVSFVQYFSEEVVQRRERFELYGQCFAFKLLPSVAERTFIARRWPTGGRDKNLETMHFRPSEALKSLKCSLEDSPQE